MVLRELIGEQSVGTSHALNHRGLEHRARSPIGCRRKRRPARPAIGCQSKADNNNKAKDLADLLGEKVRSGRSKGREGSGHRIGIPAGISVVPGADEEAPLRAKAARLTWRGGLVGAQMKSHVNDRGSRDHLTNFGWPIPHE
jgi:hypothetical protein